MSVKISLIVGSKEQNNQTEEKRTLRGRTDGHRTGAGQSEKAARPVTRRSGGRDAQRRARGPCAVITVCGARRGPEYAGTPS